MGDALLYLLLLHVTSDCPIYFICRFYNLQKDIELINSSEADWFHVDVMDGVFVPNISFGFPILKQCKETFREAAGCTPDDYSPGALP